MIPLIWLLAKCWITLEQHNRSLTLQHSINSDTLIFGGQKIKAVIITVLNGGIMAGCKKYKILATVGSSPFIFELSNLVFFLIICFFIKVVFQKIGRKLVCDFHSHKYPVSLI